MIKWEYKILDVEARETSVKLNNLGSEGWEGVGMCDISSTWIRILLKRPVSSEPAFLGVG